MKAMLKGLRMKPLAVKVGELGMYLSLKPVLYSLHLSPSMPQLFCLTCMPMFNIKISVGCRTKL